MVIEPSGKNLFISRSLSTANRISRRSVSIMNWQNCSQEANRQELWLKNQVTLTKSGRVHLVERFALAQGFGKISPQQFVHNHGRILLKSGCIFPWCLQTLDGNILQYHWVKEH